MKIIIEGCDGSGKSTLAKRLAKIFHARVEHDSEPKSIEEYSDRLAIKENVIFDRFFLGQFVYNTPEERKLSYSDLYLLVNECTRDPNVILLYLDQDEDILLDRLNNRSEEEKKKDSIIMNKVGKTDPKEFIREVKSRYEEILNRFGGFLILKGSDFNE